MLRSVAPTKNTRDGSGTRRVASGEHHALSTKRDDVHSLPAISEVQHQNAISSGQCVDGKITLSERRPPMNTNRFFVGTVAASQFVLQPPDLLGSPRRPWRSTPQTSSSIRIVRAGQHRDVEKPRNRIASRVVWCTSRISSTLILSSFALASWTGIRNAKSSSTLARRSFLLRDMNGRTFRF